MNNIAELFQTRDVLEDCRPTRGTINRKTFKKSVGVEIILKDGTRRYYRPRATNKSDMQLEVLTFIESLERATKEDIMWRYRGEEVFHMGTSAYMPNHTPSLKEKGKKILNYFFELED